MAINFKKKNTQEVNLENDNTYQNEASDVAEKEGFNLLTTIKSADNAMEETAFGNIEKKLKIVAKVVLYVFMALGLFGVVLTALLTSSLGGLGVLVALLGVAVFVFIGYGISTLIYGYASVVAKSKKADVDLSALNFQPQVVTETQVKKKEIFKDEEFPEF